MKKLNIATSCLMPVCTGRCKSFYGKAHIIKTTEGETYLKSYDTLVCKITASGEFVKLWDSYSATTMRHINNFIDMFGIAGGGKKWWENL